jgi:hypothetical protein
VALFEASEQIKEIRFEGEYGWRVVQSDRLASILEKIKAPRHVKHIRGRDVEIVMG